MLFFPYRIESLIPFSTPTPKIISQFHAQCSTENSYFPNDFSTTSTGKSQDDVEPPLQNIVYPLTTSTFPSNHQSNSSYCFYTVLYFDRYSSNWGISCPLQVWCSCREFLTSCSLPYYAYMKTCLCENYTGMSKLDAKIYFIKQELLYCQCTLPHNSCFLVVISGIWINCVFPNMDILLRIL